MIRLEIDWWPPNMWRKAKLSMREWAFSCGTRVETGSRWNLREVWGRVLGLAARISIQW